MKFWEKVLRTFRILPVTKPEIGLSSAEGNSAFDTLLRDSVTGLFNRKHLLYRMSALMSQVTRSHAMLAVVLWNIDGFVDFNNQFGQQEGDQFLKKVAEAIRGSLRPYDEAFRVGGDEFCALLMPATEKLSQNVMDRVRSMVEQNVITSNDQYKGRKFTISSGTVFYPGEHNLPEALLHAAQQELYKNRRSRTERSLS
ncbi:MAG: diguanylate cyclase [Bdellovibrionales bacterium]|nr:diguanylate cyclase [Bdellovibrionales bacterium]